MPFRLLRDPPCPKKKRDEELEKLREGHYWSAQTTRSERNMTLAELLFCPLIFMFWLGVLVEGFITFNTTNSIDIGWAVVNIVILALMGISIILLLALYRKWFSTICISCIRFKFYRMEGRVSSDNIRHVLNKYIQNEWEH